MQEHMTPADVDRQAAEWLVSLHEVAGIDAPEAEAYPVSTDHVVQLLQGCGYRVTCGDLLAWCKSGALPVPMQAGQRQWFPSLVRAAMAHAESRRRWDPYHPMHRHKMTVVELAQAQRDAAGGGSVFRDLGKFDAEQLALYMEECEDRETRHALRVALMTKLTEAK